MRKVRKDPLEKLRTNKLLTHVVFLVATFVLFSGAASALKAFAGTDLWALVGSVFPETITPEMLKDKYEKQTIRVVVVPGHDNQYVGTVFKGRTEAEHTRKIARHLMKYLENDERFTAIVVRDTDTGKYTDTFSNYFTQKENEIKSFMKERRSHVKVLKNEGIIKSTEIIDHNYATSNTAIRLYGVNKWSNENSIDLILHMHFNDYPRRTRSNEGKYSGFALYVPDSQYSNGRASRDVAEVMQKELAQFLPESDLPKEKGGIIEAQELIALGSNASQRSAALLIEYGYIYEAQFVNADTREIMFEELALQTYNALKNYFDKEYNQTSYVTDTTLLPYTFKVTLKKGMQGSRDVLSLQAALHAEGLYPPDGKSLNDCPINGNFGPCVAAAVSMFQEKYKETILTPLNINKASGIVGGRTRAQLNILYGVE
ncbi:hypothetical protein COB55_01585 [Candidatus Wolfebacteria bacterium]|nr:MAG: hypothetical protein COB55_01585 [Candidatus Wolfebacteria bacterium]